MSPRTGRPKVEDPNIIRTSINLNRATEKRLEAYCEKYGIRKAMAIRLGLLKLLDDDEMKNGENPSTY